MLAAEGAPKWMKLKAIKVNVVSWFSGSIQLQIIWNDPGSYAFWLDKYAQESGKETCSWGSSASCSWREVHILSVLALQKVHSCSCNYKLFAGICCWSSLGWVWLTGKRTDHSNLHRLIQWKHELTHYTKLTYWEWQPLYSASVYLPVSHLPNLLCITIDTILYNLM